MTSPPLAGLDRVSIAVENLEVARESFAKLGFQVSQRGRHVRRGTGNYSLVLSGVDGRGTYIELIAQTDRHEKDAQLLAYLDDQGEGLVSIALKTENGEAAVEQLALGADANLQQTYRSVTLDGVTKMASFNLLDLLDRQGMRPQIGAVEHLSPDLVFAEELQNHANTAMAIREIHVRSDSVRDDVIAAAPFCTPAQTQAQARAVEGLMDGKRVARLTFLSDKAWADLYGDDLHGKDLDSKEAGATTGLVIECENAITAKHVLEEAGFEPEFVNSRLNGYRIPVSKTHGVWFTFVSK